MHPKTIEQVKQEHTEAWMAIPGVVGTGIGQCKDEPCILILTASNTERIRKQSLPLSRVIPSSFSTWVKSGPLTSRNG